MRWLFPTEAPAAAAAPVIQTDPALEAIRALGIERDSSVKLYEALGSSEAVAELLSKPSEPLIFERVHRSEIKLTVSRAEALSVLGRLMRSLGVVRGRIGNLSMEWFESAQMIVSGNGVTGTLYLESGIYRALVVAEGNRVDFIVSNPGRTGIDNRGLASSKINGTIVEKP